MEYQSKCNYGGISHYACANAILLGRVVKRCQHHPTTSNNTQNFSPLSNFAQHHPTIPNIIQQCPTSPKNTQHHPTMPSITQQCPTWVAKRSQHLYPTLLAFVGQKCLASFGQGFRDYAAQWHHCFSIAVAPVCPVIHPIGYLMFCFCCSPNTHRKKDRWTERVFFER